VTWSRDDAQPVDVPDPQRASPASAGIIGSMQAKVPNANLQKSTTAAGILIDKAQLLRQRRTSIQAGVYLTQEQKVARLDEIFAPHLLQLAENVVQAHVVEEEMDESRSKLPRGSTVGDFGRKLRLLKGICFQFCFGRQLLNPTG
jgi:hypothetical protein